MDIGSIFLILALAIPVVIFIGRPLFDLVPSSRQPARQAISALLAERDQLVAAIQELDDDFNLDKIPAENYSSQHLGLLKKGADVLRQIDTYQSSTASTAAEERLEDAIQKHRLSLDVNHTRKNGNAVPPVPDDDLEQKIATRRRTMQGKAGGFCPKCGRPIQVSDRFCSHCGATLS
jgi:hypothetical protein